MADDYIRRQAAIDIVVFECGKWTGLAKEISKQLKQLPATDVAPVVRCKDCLFFTTEKSCCRPEGLIKAREDDFCSYGERKE